MFTAISANAPPMAVDARRIRNAPMASIRVRRILWKRSKGMQHNFCHAAKSPAFAVKTLATLLVVLFLGFESLAIANDKGIQRAAGTTGLKPNEYTWNPGVSPRGPVGIIVDLTHQTIYVYRSGKLIGCSAISTGIPSHPTTAGTYTILTKNRTYHSEKYHEASMPYMERLTWDGMAIHGGSNPGKPSSHGCIHVPLDFAQKLYGITTEGDTVLISDLKNAPGNTVDPGLLPQQTPQPAPDPKSKVKVPRGGPPPTDVSPKATPIPTS